LLLYSISIRFRVLRSKRIWVKKFDLSGSRDVISHMTIRFHRRPFPIRNYLEPSLYL